MKHEIKYSHIDYILVRTDIDQCNDTDVCLYSFDTLKKAQSYAKKDIAHTMKNIGIVYSNECDNAVSYEKYCGNDYWCYESDGLCISWEIRKIHNRTTSEWDDPEYVTKWKKDGMKS